MEYRQRMKLFSQIDFAAELEKLSLGDDNVTQELGGSGNGDPVIDERIDDAVHGDIDLVLGVIPQEATKVAVVSVDCVETSPEATYFSRMGFRVRDDMSRYVPDDDMFMSLEYLRKNVHRLMYQGDSVCDIQLPPVGYDHLSDVAMNYGCIVDGKYVHFRGEGHHIVYGYRTCNPDFQVPLIRFQTVVGWRSILCFPDRAVVVESDRPATFELIDDVLVLVSFDVPSTNFTFVQAVYREGVDFEDRISITLVDGQQVLSAQSPFVCLRAISNPEGTTVFYSSEGQAICWSRERYDSHVMYWVRVRAEGELEGVAKFSSMRFAVFQKSKKVHPYTQAMAIANLNKGSLRAFNIFRTDVTFYDLEVERVPSEMFAYHARNVACPMSQFMMRQHKSVGYFYHSFLQYVDASGGKARLSSFFSQMASMRYCMNRGRLLPVPKGDSAELAIKFEIYVQAPLEWARFCVRALQGVLMTDNHHYYCHTRSSAVDVMAVLARLPLLRDEVSAFVLPQD